jgi:DnaJ family protein C protein 19
VLRLVLLALAVSLACKLLLGRWPWDYLLPRSTRSQPLFLARKLLDVRADASRTEILDAHKRLIIIVHPDKGGSNSQVHEANAARDLLLDELPDGN